MHGVVMAVLGASLAGQQANAETTGPIPLEVRLSVGVRYYYLMSSTTRITDPSAPESWTEVEYASVLGVDVEGATGQRSRRLLLRFPQSRGVAKNAEGEMRYESKKDFGEEEPKGLLKRWIFWPRFLVGLHVPFQSDPAGKPVVPAATLDHLGNDFVDELVFESEFEPEELAIQVAQELTRTLQWPLGSALPEAPVRPGGQWRAEDRCVLVGYGAWPVRLAGTYKGFETHRGRNCALVELTGSVLDPPARDAETDETEETAGESQAKISDSKVAGKLWLDARTGVVLDEQIDYQFTICQPGAKSRNVRQTASMRFLKVEELAQ